MGVNSKHLATFLLGAAAALAAKKYMDMSDEEKAKLATDLRDKANGFKKDAEQMMDKAQDYFEELQRKGGEALKEQLPEAEQFLKDLFGAKKEEPKA